MLPTTSFAACRAVALAKAGIYRAISNFFAFVKIFATDLRGRAD
jgi:hypothetical protein